MPPTVPERLSGLEQRMAMTEQRLQDLHHQLAQMPHLTRAQTDALAQLVSDRTVEKAVAKFKGQMWKMAAGILVTSAAMTGAIVELIHVLGLGRP